MKVCSRGGRLEQEVVNWTLFLLPELSRLPLRMALKAIIHKANVSFSDLDRNVYRDHNLTIARHPSETGERMMVRLLAWALNAPDTGDEGALEFAKDMWEPDQPCLVQNDLTGLRLHEIDLGQPEERRLLRACGRSRHVTVYAYTSGSQAWWASVAAKMSKVSNLSVWQIDPEQAKALGLLAEKSMDLQITVQDGVITVDGGGRSAEIQPERWAGG